MSPETEPPRQRTVAELLAENGAAVAGRRRRRREADDESGPGTAGPSLSRESVDLAPDGPYQPPVRRSTPDTARGGEPASGGRPGGPPVRRGVQASAPTEPAVEPPPWPPNRNGSAATGDPWAGPARRPGPAFPSAEPGGGRPGNGIDAARPAGPGAAAAPGQNGTAESSRNVTAGSWQGGSAGSSRNGTAGSWQNGPGGPRQSGENRTAGPGRNGSTGPGRDAGPGQNGAGRQNGTSFADGQPPYGRPRTGPGPLGGRPRDPAAPEAAATPNGFAPSRRPGQPDDERHTEQIARLGAPSRGMARDGGGPDEDLRTSPFEPVVGTGARPGTARGDGGPPTQWGAPPLDDDEDDGGPLTQLGAPPLRDDGPPTVLDGPPKGLDGPPKGLDDRPRHDDPAELDDLGLPGPGRGAGPPPAGLAGGAGDLDGLDEFDEADADPDEPAQAGTGQAWAAVIAQWIAGALAGAAVWVGFRFLWFNLPVVALAAAVVLTVGLVLGVRALLRNDDLRTTLFAVGVGLLLTVSPALLVLLDR